MLVTESTYICCAPTECDLHWVQMDPRLNYPLAGSDLRSLIRQVLSQQSTVFKSTGVYETRRPLLVGWELEKYQRYLEKSTGRQESSKLAEIQQRVKVLSHAKPSTEEAEGLSITRSPSPQGGSVSNRTKENVSLWVQTCGTDPPGLFQQPMARSTKGRVTMLPTVRSLEWQSWRASEGD